MCSQAPGECGSVEQKEAALDRFIKTGGNPSSSPKKKKKKKKEETPGSPGAADGVTFDHQVVASRSDIHAATQIQARQRGKASRKQMQSEHDAAVIVQKMARGKQARAAALGMLVPLEGAAPKELVDVFQKLDADEDGMLKHADMVRLDEACGRSSVLDPAGWLMLCEMVGCQSPNVGLTQTDLWQYYAQAGDDELMEAWNALFAKDVKEQTQAAVKIQAKTRGKQGKPSPDLSIAGMFYRSAHNH